MRDYSKRAKFFVCNNGGKDEGISIFGVKKVRNFNDRVFEFKMDWDEANELRAELEKFLMDWNLKKMIGEGADGDC